jgi:hypothetical protein
MGKLKRGGERRFWGCGGSQENLQKTPIVRYV